MCICAGGPRSRTVFLRQLIVHFEELHAFGVSVDSDDPSGNLGDSNWKLHVNNHGNRFFKYEPQHFHDLDFNYRLSVVNHLLGSFILLLALGGGGSSSFSSTSTDVTNGTYTLTLTGTDTQIPALPILQP